ncbi:hypothetical protein B0H13DRAFT_1872198 [Mycena leptocephala]|nr:hypothetical protein B0H13DRAFT_1872198 [Mycena leptocephala]
MSEKRGRSSYKLAMGLQKVSTQRFWSFEGRRWCRDRTKTPRKLSNNQNFDLFIYAVVSLKNVQLPLLKASYHGTIPQHKRENSAYHPDLGQFYHGCSGASLGLELSEDWWRSWAYNVPTRHSSCGGGLHKRGQSENELGVGVAHRAILCPETFN